MPGKVRFNAKDNLIEIHSWGEVTNSEMFRSQGEVERLFQEKKATKVLFDTERVETLPSPYMLYEFVVSLLDTRNPIALRFALQTHAGLKNDMRFVENVAVNRGILAKNFLDRRQALTWLNH